MTDVAQGLQAPLSRAELNVLPSLDCSNISVVFSAFHLGALFIWTQQIPPALPFPVGQSSHEDKCYIVEFADRNFAVYFFIWRDFPDRGRRLVGNTLAFCEFYFCVQIYLTSCMTLSISWGIFPESSLYSYWSLILYTLLVLCRGVCLWKHLCIRIP